MHRGVKTVQKDVAVYHVHGFLGAVHRIYVDGAASKGVNGESARVAEKVKDTTATGKGAHPGAVFPLVQEEARLLALGPVYQEFVAVFEDDKFVLVKSGGLVQIAVNQFQAGFERGRAGTLVVHGLEGTSVHLPKSRADCGL